MTPNIHIRETSAKPSSFLIITALQGYKQLKGLPANVFSDLQVKAKRDGFIAKDGEILHFEYISDSEVKHIYVIGLGEKKQMKEGLVRNKIIEAMRLARRIKISELDVIDDVSKLTVRSLVEAICIGTYSFDRFMGTEHKKKYPPIRDVYLTKTDSTQSEIEKGVQTAEAQMLTRDLVNIPASHMHPEIMLKHAHEIEKKSKGKVTVKALTKNECEKLGMGAFLGVAEGSERPSYFIVLHYKGAGKKTLSLVGKSITFDSGGLSLKPSDGMMDMKIDMAGGATVLGIFDYFAAAQPRVHAFGDIYGLLPACENMPSGKAMKPGDIVTALNGKTIEVLNTDAEGRLALADALVYAEKNLKSDYIIDLATLTGACMVALGSDLAGLFSNSASFEKLYKPYTEEVEDLYWQMPLQETYAKQMKSKIADLKNIGGGRYGGAITAALFLREFVEKANWMHIDIAGPAHKDSEGATGWGVVSIIHFLEEQKDL
ncbi:MAG: leucyl aminopeptidase [Microgenomates group bacterium]